MAQQQAIRSSYVVRLHASVALLCLCSSWIDWCTAICTPQPVFTNCPTDAAAALAAAQALTGNQPELVVTNAVFSGTCNGASAKRGIIHISNFGCHYLNSKMPLGAVVLSNGNAALGASTESSTDAVSTQQGGSITDADMQAVSAAVGYNQVLKDIAVLSFDITPTVSGPLAFQYVFGSEEYSGYDNSVPIDQRYNDVFGFFMWSSGAPQNVALLPGSTNPVSIATINPDLNTFYIDNWDTPVHNTEIKGFTTVLKTADYNVTAGVTYHIKLAIADGHDTSVDSVVWVKAGSVRFNIKDCVGSWVANGNCSGACDNGSGFLPEVYRVTVAAQNGGNDCSTANGTTRTSTVCTNTNPCPINCTGSWVNNGNCTGTCQGGHGFIPEVFVVTSPALYGGSCPHNNGTTRLTQACTNNELCPPRHCVGGWVANGPCNGACGGGSGLLPETYFINVTAAYGGNDCSDSNGTTRLSTTCSNTTPCPVDCVGSWIVPDSSNCTGHCSGGAGFTPEEFEITQINVHGGSSCPAANGTTRLQINCTNNVPCPPVHCVGVWLPHGLCNGTCGNGTGILPEIYNITTQPAYGGNNCSFSTGDTRTVTTCTNSTPCPIDCVGNWTLNGVCTGQCEGGNGTLPEIYTVTTPAQYGGASCPYAHGDTRSIVNCTNSAMCPINCTYLWQDSANCTGSCGNGTGTIQEKFIITAPPMYGGTCPRTNGSTRSTKPCINYDVCPPVNCVGSFVNNPPNTCNGTCGGGAGWQRQVYTITTAAAWGGNPCPESAGTQQWIPCNNTNCCPVACVGSWVQNGNCTGHCSGGAGKLPEKWFITVPSSCGGATCPANGTLRNSTNCTNTTPCPPVNCVGSWVAGQCNGTCGGGAGLLPETFIITTAAAYNGTECNATHNAFRIVQHCNNTNPCPVHCSGNWTIPDNNNCTGACDGGSGFTPELYVTTQAEMYGGTPCAAGNNTVRLVIPCNNTTPCPPQDCVGDWVSDGPCRNGCRRVNMTHDRDAGRRPVRYVITTPALRNGTECPFNDGDTGIGNCVNNAWCSPEPCIASWVATGTCNGTCGGGPGFFPERYHVTKYPLDYGTNCTHTNGTVRQTACTNSAPCPIHCAGSWLTNGSCIASCNNGTGFLPEIFHITTLPQFGGTACQAAEGGTRNNVTACINHTPCPVDCLGHWVPANASFCNGTCGGGTGHLPETYIINSLELHGGTPCPQANLTVRHVACDNTKECPINCTGVWINQGQPSCSALCGGGSGFTVEYFNITQIDMYDGVPCLQPNGTMRNGSACTNSTPCAINCVGSYVRNGNCTGTCATNSQGMLPEVYVITVPPDHGGLACPAANGSTRAALPCISQAPCPCIGQYVEAGACTALCSNIGILPERYFVAKLATFGGHECPVANGTTRFTTQCTNTTVCPWADVVVVDSPPVLPPLDMSTFNDSDIVIKGGNVSITGVKIEGLSGFSNSSVSTGSFGVVGTSTSSVTSNTTSGAKALKPRIASFNGTLGFYTFGIIVEVLGEFELQRSMEWTWDTEWNAWTTQVAIRGTFVLTREEIVNNVTVGLETMKPTVSGYLNLFSSIYPGPGFSGNYDWAGELELSPDPFTEWQDAQSLLQPQNPSTPAASKRRALLASSTGMVPVQGRVGVRESKTPVDTSNDSPTSAALDDTGDIMVVCQGTDQTCMTQLQLGQQQASGKDSKTYLDNGAAAKDVNMRLIIILLAALVAPVGIALCATGVAAGIIYKRRRKKEKEDEDQKDGKLKRLHKHHDGAVAGRQNNENFEGSIVHQRAKPIWRSSDGSGPVDPIAMSAVPAGNPWFASAGPAELERLSNPGSSNQISHQHSGDDDGSTVQRVRPGETGFGSIAGGSGAMVTLPPARDSAYGGAHRQTQDYFVPGSSVDHTGTTGMWQAARRSLAGSLAGMANALAHPFSRQSQAGEAYRIPDSSLVQSSGPSFFTMFSATTRSPAHIPPGVHGELHGINRVPSIPEEISASGQPTASAHAAGAAGRAPSKHSKSRHKSGTRKKRGL